MKLNILFWYRKNYRVTEEIMGDGTSHYFPEHRANFFKPWKRWKRLTENSTYTSSLERANEYIYDKVKEEKAQTIVKKRTHLFDEVFHILKHKDESN